MSSRPLFKQANDLSGPVQELLQAWDDRLILENPKLRERYLRGNLSPHIHLGVKFSDAEVGKFCIALKYAPPISRELPAGILNMPEGAGDEDEFPVFFRNVHFVDDLQQMVSGGVALIWLQTLNDCLSGGANTLYFSSIFLRFIFLRRVFLENWELDGSGALLPVSLIGKLPCEMVKCGAHLMDDFASKHTKSNGDFAAKVQFPKLLNGLHVIIGDASITAIIEKEVDLPFEVDDVLFGPF